MTISDFAKKHGLTTDIKFGLIKLFNKLNPTAREHKLALREAERCRERMKEAEKKIDDLRHAIEQLAYDDDYCSETIEAITDTLSTEIRW